MSCGSERRLSPNRIVDELNRPAELGPPSVDVSQEIEAAVQIHGADRRVALVLGVVRLGEAGLQGWWRTHGLFRQEHTSGREASPERGVAPRWSWTCCRLLVDTRRLSPGPRRFISSLMACPSGVWVPRGSPR